MHMTSNPRPITVTAFTNIPEAGYGRIKDLRVRWALNEAGLPYQTRLVTPDALDGPEH
jgi:glutathione S-transferase